jgi:hypothetical protein
MISDDRIPLDTAPDGAGPWRVQTGRGNRPVRSRPRSLSVPICDAVAVMAPSPLIRRDCAIVDRICDADVLSARKRGLGGICADDARPVESRSAELVLDVCDSGRIYCPDLLELERPTVEFRE